MATNSATKLFRGLLTTTTSTVLYTVPGSTTTIVTEILLVNLTGSAQSTTINIAGVAIVPANVNVPANSIMTMDIKQVMAATETITGGTANANAINCFISGIQVA